MDHDANSVWVLLFIAGYYVDIVGWNPPCGAHVRVDGFQRRWEYSGKLRGRCSSGEIKTWLRDKEALVMDALAGLFLGEGGKACVSCMSEGFCFTIVTNYPILRLR